MTMIFVVTLVLCITAVLLPALQEDLRRGERRCADRRLGGYLVDLTTWTVTRSRAIPPHTAYVIRSEPVLPDVSSLWPEPTPEERWERNRRAFMREERLALTIQRPEKFVTIVGVS